MISSPSAIAGAAWRAIFERNVNHLLSITSASIGSMPYGPTLRICRPAFVALLGAALAMLALPAVPLTVKPGSLWPDPTIRVCWEEPRLLQSPTTLHFHPIPVQQRSAQFVCSFPF